MIFRSCGGAAVAAVPQLLCAKHGARRRYAVLLAEDLAGAVELAPF